MVFGVVYELVDFLLVVANTFIVDTGSKRKNEIKLASEVLYLEKGKPNLPILHEHKLFFEIS